MNKNTQIIDFQKMHKLKTPPSRYSELSVSISEKGMLTISSSLFNKMEKFDNKVIADFLKIASFFTTFSKIFLYLHYT